MKIPELSKEQFNELLALLPVADAFRGLIGAQSRETVNSVEVQAAEAAVSSALSDFSGNRLTVRSIETADGYHGIGWKTLK